MSKAKKNASSRDSYRSNYQTFSNENEVSRPLSLANGSQFSKLSEKDTVKPAVLSKMAVFFWSGCLLDRKSPVARRNPTQALFTTGLDLNRALASLQGRNGKIVQVRPIKGLEKHPRGMKSWDQDQRYIKPEQHSRTSRDAKPCHEKRKASMKPI